MTLETLYPWLDDFTSISQSSRARYLGYPNRLQRKPHLRWHIQHPTSNTKYCNRMFEAMESTNEVHSVGVKFSVGHGYTHIKWDFGSWQLLWGVVRTCPTYGWRYFIPSKSAILMHGYYHDVGAIVLKRWFMGYKFFHNVIKNLNNVFFVLFFFKFNLRLAVQFPTMNSPLYLTKKLARWSTASCALALACWPSVFKKRKISFVGRIVFCVYYVQHCFGSE